MLECATMVNRCWRNLKDDLTDARIGWIPALAEEIEASQQDLKREVWDVVMWAQKCSSQSVPVPEDFQLPYFRTWNDGLIELVEKVEVYIQKLVVAVRSSRRMLCGDNSKIRLHGGTQAYRSSTCEYLAIDIGKLQDDLSGALTEMMSICGMSWLAIAKIPTQTTSSEE